MEVSARGLGFRVDQGERGGDGLARIRVRGGTQDPRLRRNPVHLGRSGRRCPGGLDFPPPWTRILMLWPQEDGGGRKVSLAPLHRLILPEPVNPNSNQSVSFRSW